MVQMHHSPGLIIDEPQAPPRPHIARSAAHGIVKVVTETLSHDCPAHGAQSPVPRPSRPSPIYSESPKPHSLHPSLPRSDGSAPPPAYLQIRSKQTEAHDDRCRGSGLPHGETPRVRVEGQGTASARDGNKGANDMESNRR